MAYYNDFGTVKQVLNQLRARLVKETPRGDIYVTASQKWVRVARSGGGFDMAVFQDRASCGCG
jgi:hypothetical protein